MSATTTAPAPAKTSATTRRRANHLYRIAEANLAREMGVQVRALCGRWTWPRPVFGGSIANTGLSPNVCRQCEASLARIKRERARQAKGREA